MKFIELIGALLILSGVFNLKTYVQRRHWPVVEGKLDSIDTQIEARSYSKGAGFFIRPKYIQKIKYSYHGHPYVIEISGYEIKEGGPKLRVDPERPYLAYLDSKKILFPVLAISIGLILILLSIKVRFTENNE